KTWMFCARVRARCPDRVKSDPRPAGRGADPKARASRPIASGLAMRSSGCRPAAARWATIVSHPPSRHRASRPALWRTHMGMVSLVWGILAMVWMVFALIPLVGITNWLLIPFAAVGAIIAAVGLLFTRTGRRGRAKAGLVLNGIVIFVAIWRLGLGGGLI